MKLAGIIGGIVGLLGLGAGVAVFAHESLKVSGEVPIYYTEIIVNPPSDLVETEEQLPPPVIEPTPSVTVFPTLAPTTPPLPSKTPTAEPTPTVTPSTAPSPTIQPTVTPVMTHMDIKTLIALMARHYEVDENTLLHIAQCESSLNPMASHLTYAGLYQFSPGAWQTYRKLMGKDANSDLRTEPLAAIETAAYVLSIGKERIWPSCLP